MTAWNELGLDQHAFFRLTPRLFVALLDDRREAELDERTQAEYRAAVVACTVANYSVGAPEKPRTPDSFPFLMLQPPPVRERKETPKQRARREQRLAECDQRWREAELKRLHLFEQVNG